MVKNTKIDFVIRIALATALMGAGLWYLGSLWNARMREQNLILIEPVVILMIPFYLSILVHEYRRYRRELHEAMAQEVPDDPVRDAVVREAKRDQIAFLAVAAASIPVFYLLGAVPATILQIATGLLVLGVRKPIALISAPLIVTFCLWLVFVELFGIRIPLIPEL